MADFDTTDAIFFEPSDEPHGKTEKEDDEEEEEDVNKELETACECESCVEGCARAEEIAEETKRLQQCWMEVREAFLSCY